MHRLTICGLLALMAGGFSDARAALQPPEVSGGAVTVTNPSTGHYVATVNSGTNVTLRLRFDAGDVVEEIVIVPLDQTGARVRVNIDGVEPDDQPFYGLDSINRVVRGEGAGEVWIDLVRANRIGDVDRDLEIGGNPNPNYGKTSGQIRANVIGEVRANWSVFADIEATGTALSNPGGITINLVDAERNLDWGPQFALDGAILGNIKSNGGNIGTIRASADSFIGAVNNEASNNTQIIDTNGGNIGVIQAGSLGEVTIDCLGSSNGRIGSITTFPGGWGYDEGREVYLGDPIDFDPSDRPMGFTAGGALRAGDIEDLNLKGSLDSVMAIYSVAQDGIWKIGDSLGPNALITLRNSGLTGQIAINANGGDGQWLGAIRVAETNNVEMGPWFPPLNQADHNASPSALGGGSAGLQGYALWANSCDPVPGSTRFRGYLDPTSFEADPPCIENFDTIRVGFYGNIERATGVANWDDTVVLKRKNMFGVFAPLSGVSVANNGRFLFLTKSGGGLWETGEYEVEVLANKIRVRNTDVFQGAPRLLVPPTTYTFGVAKGCEALDLNGDLLITYEDMVEWMIEPVNLNNQPTVDGADASTLQRGIHEHGPEN